MSMTDRLLKLVVGSLFHDLGKIIYRSGTDSRNHSISGYDFVKNEIGIEDLQILNCIRYHHVRDLNNANIADDDLCYLTYFADNIAAAIDRRVNDLEEGGENQENNFDKKTPLESVFNILNNNKEKKHYKQALLSLENEINYPTDDKGVLDPSFYLTIKQNLIQNLKGIKLSESDLSSVLSLFEANFSYIPSSTNKNELVDIPLYDHLKLTACFASCMERYLSENQITNYRQKFITHAEKTYDEEMFLLVSMDISGIQNFIYTITTDAALKELRARSIYLEIMMEHIIDELLTKLSLSRINLIYSGGGHCYLVLPNTESTKQTIDEFEKEINSWFMKNFDVALYIGIGYAACSSNSLRNKSPGSYSDIFRSVTRMISDKKLHRYSADELRTLNSQKLHGERECAVCRRVGSLNEKNRCFICSSFEKFASDVMKYKYFAVITEFTDGALVLPFDRYLIASTENRIRNIMSYDCYVKTYVKNNLHMGDRVEQNLWIGDYNYKGEFKDLADSAEGIKRIAVLRADVDNLGNTFVNGFKRKNNDSYTTLTRSAVLSRQLSLFFKGYIKKILNNPSERLLMSNENLAVNVVYSGGDDVFLVGAWNDVIDAFINLRNAFRKFTQNTLSISGGIGIYSHSFPINVMAQEVAALEECSKQMEGKDAVTVFESQNSYKWDDFLDSVLSDKFSSLKDFMDCSDLHGNSFLYNIMDLLRNTDEKINIARLIYLLSRLEPPKNASLELQKKYRIFSEKIYKWARNETDRKQFIGALNIFVYLSRKEED